jgi:Carbohydrate family 9 binding domain-like/Glycosyl hydrolase family 20, catalytic domain
MKKYLKLSLAILMVLLLGNSAVYAKESMQVQNFVADKHKAVEVTVVDPKLNLFVEQKIVAINLDGKLNDSAWQDSQWHSNFTDYRTGASAVHLTRFKVIRTATGLYIGIEAAGGRPVANCKQRDGQLFDDDIVEVFLTPEFGSKERRQFAVNALGTQFDSIPVTPHGVKWNGNWQSSCMMSNDGYTAEIFLPNKAAGISAGTKIMGFNICRESKIKGKQRNISSWAGIHGMKAAFFSYWKYGRLIFGVNKHEEIKINFITHRDHKLTVDYSSLPTSPLYGRMNYFYRKNIAESDYREKVLPFKGAAGSLVLPVWDDLSAGEQFIMAYKLDRSGDVTACVLFRFRLENPPKYMDIGYVKPKFIPQVKKAVWQQELCDLKLVKKIIYYASADGYEKETAVSIKKYICPSAAIVQGRGLTAGKNSIVIGSLKSRAFVRWLSKADKKLLSEIKSISVPTQGYMLELGKNNSAILAGQDGVGAYYAFRTMLQVFRQNKEWQWQGTVIDWPDHQRREVCLTAQQLFSLGFAPWKDNKKFIFDVIAGAKYNELVISADGLEFTDGENPKMNHKNAYPKNKFKKFLKLAQENHIKLIPMYNSHGRYGNILRAYPAIHEFPQYGPQGNKTPKNSDQWRHKFIACTKHPDYYKVILPVYRELWEMFNHPETMHICHDEIVFSQQEDDIWSCPRCKKTLKWQIVRDDIIKIADYLKSLGVTEVRMWSDILQKNWNGGKAPAYIYKMTAYLPKDLIAPVNWGGNHSGKHISSEELFKAGFEKIIYCDVNAINYKGLMPDLDKFHAVGTSIYGTTSPWISWGMHALSSQGAFTALYRGADIMWNFKSKNNFITSLDFPYKFGNALMKITSNRNGSSKGILKKIKLDKLVPLARKWKLPLEKIDFSKIKQYTDQSHYRILAGDGSAVILDNQNRQVVIPVDAECSAIALLHTAYMGDNDYRAFIKKIEVAKWTEKEYRYKGFKFGSYTIEYQDGRKVSRDIAFGYNIFFCMHPDYLRNMLQYDASELWLIPHVESPLMAWVYILKNPHPREKIKNLIVNKTENLAEIGIFAAATIEKN